MSAFVFRVEAKVSYTDGTSADFGAAIDEDGNITTFGLAATLADILTQFKALFTALGGSLTCSPTASGKVVRDYTARIDGLGVVSDVKKDFFSEYTVKTGVHVQGAADYVSLVANYKTEMQNALAALAGVSVTIA